MPPLNYSTERLSITNPNLHLLIKTANRLLQEETFLLSSSVPYRILYCHTAICGKSSYSILRPTSSESGLCPFWISSKASPLILSSLHNVPSSQFLAFLSIWYRLNMTSAFSWHSASINSQNFANSPWLSRPSVITLLSDLLGCYCLNIRRKPT